MPNFVEIGRTVAEIWRFSDFEDGGRPPSWILKMKLLPSLGQKESQCVIIPRFIPIRQIFAELWRFKFFKMAAVRHLRFFKIEFLTMGALRRINMSSCKISWRFFDFFKMTTVGHIGFVVRMFRRPTTSTRWCLSPYKIWLESMQ